MSRHVWFEVPKSLRCHDDFKSGLDDETKLEFYTEKSTTDIRVPNLKVPLHKAARLFRSLQFLTVTFLFTFYLNLHRFFYKSSVVSAAGCVL